MRAPNLVGIAGTRVPLVGGSTALADDTYLRESILDPAAQVAAGYNPIMPTYRGQISEENIFRLLAYIQSLAGGREGTAPGDQPAAGAETGATAAAAAPAGSPAAAGVAEGTR